MSAAAPVHHLPAERRGRAEAALKAVHGASAEGVASMFLPYQQRWIFDDSRVGFWEKSRRIGADFCEAFRAVRERFGGECNRDLWYSSADESAALEFMVYVQSFAQLYVDVAELVFETDIIDGKDVRVMRLTCPEVGGRRPRISAMTSNPRTFRSKGGDVTLSEFAFHRDAGDMWKAAYPSITWGGKMRVISSHHGAGSEFNRKVQGLRRRIDPATHGAPKPYDLAGSLHRVTILDAVEGGLVERINRVSGVHRTREAFLEDLRRDCGSDLVWREEYLCEPSDEAGSYFPYTLTRECVSVKAAPPTELIAELVNQICHRAADCTELVAGCDVGRHTDEFVVWVLGKVGGMRRTVGLLAWSGRDFGEMEHVLRSLMDMTFVRGDGAGVGTGLGGRGLRIRRLAIDATGLGMQLAERLERDYRGRVEGVSFTASVKADLMTGLRAAVEERTINLPDDPATLAQFAAVRREVTAAGNVRYKIDQTETGHGDRPVAAALALHAADRHAAPVRMLAAAGGVLG